MKVSVKNSLFSIIVSILYFGVILRFPYFVNKYFKSEFMVKNLININLFVLLLFGIIVYVICKKYPTNSISGDKKKESLVRSVLIGIVSGVVLLLGIQVLYQVVKIFGYSADTTGEFIRIKNVVSNNKISLINMVLIVPIVTEVIYRNIIFGYLYDLYEGGYKCVRFGTPVVLTGILFGLVSMGTTVPLTLGSILMSTIFSYIFLKTKRVESSIVANIVFNVGMVVLAFVVKTSVL